MNDDNQGVAMLADSLNLSECLPSENALACLAAENAARLNVLPIAILRESGFQIVLLACVDVNDSAQQERVARHISTDYRLRFVQCQADELRSVIAQCYRARLSWQELLCAANESSQDASATVDQIPVELVNALIVQAVSRRASDIHVSPESTRIQVRLRIDGVLSDFVSLNRSLLSGLMVRLKIMAALDISETRYPQDGQFRRLVDGRNVDFRVSTFPTIDGENTVLRLIDEQQKLHSLSALNLPAEIEAHIRRIMSKPEGLIVVCGPTGAGKSTTLFALLDNIDCVSRSVMTLEDPVEHRVAGTRQTSIDVARHWGYPEGLRALLRQDPDVLLIGEIRDAESCAIALRAVSTGHQVLTTVHAASAHAALHRLRELDAGAGALALGLVAVVAQRLIRRVCKHCSSRQSSCEVCHGTGYSGRQVIMELMEITEDIKTLLAQGAGIDVIRQVSEDAGFVDLREQAMRQISAGHCTHEELNRVLGTKQRQGCNQVE